MDAPHVLAEFGAGLRAHLGFQGQEPAAPALEPEPAPEPEDPRERELAERLAYLAAAEAALAERERLLAEREREAEQQAARLESDARVHGETIRGSLRRRAEEQADRVWDVFAGALDATGSDGAPDHSVRLAAARALLAEAYDAPEGDPVAAADDELARLRLARLAGGGA